MTDTPLKVLVVDDDLNLRRIMSHMLHAAGHTIIEGRNGLEAIKLTRDHKPDVVVMDVMMPMVDGFTACKELRNNPMTRNIPVVMCTARSGKDDLITAIRASANDYIVKPFTRETLIQKVAKAAAARHTDETAAPTASERRELPRKPVEWTLSLGKGADSCMKSIYKTRILDISARGFAFEFPRCAYCTGYQQGTVHKDCLFIGNSLRRHDTPPLDFILSISPSDIIEARGKIAHIYQPPGSDAEKIGVTITSISDEARRLLIKITSQKQYPGTRTSPPAPTAGKKELQTEGAKLQ